MSRASGVGQRALPTASTPHPVRLQQVAFGFQGQPPPIISLPPPAPKLSPAQPAVEVVVAHSDVADIVVPPEEVSGSAGAVAAWTALAQAPNACPGATTPVHALQPGKATLVASSVFPHLLVPAS